MSCENEDTRTPDQPPPLPAEPRAEASSGSGTSAPANRYRTLFEQAPDAIAIVALDGTLLEVNRRFEHETGLSRAQGVGQNLFTSPTLMARESRDRARLHVKEFPADRPWINLELYGQKEDGRTVPYEVHLAPIHESGRIVAVQAILRNISKRKDDERVLRTSEETARVLLNAFSGAAFLIDTKGVVLAANHSAAERYDLTPAELIGRSPAEFLPPEVAENRRLKALEVIRSGQPLRFEDETDGQVFNHSIHPVFDEAGRVIKLAVFSRDVTNEQRAHAERSKLAAQLQQAQKMEAIGTLAGGIAHDFNNLLMAIQGNVSLMLFKIDEANPHHRVLTNIEKLVRSGADLTSKLLGYARKGRYEARPLRLNDLVLDTSETFGRMRKDIVIYRDLAEDLKNVLADKGQIEQVLLNLLVNAADAMPSGGKLFLKTRNITHRDIPPKGYVVNPGPYVELTVSDTGSGMEQAVIARIFDPFFTTKKKGRGTGLGLASAYGIVKGHNGYIDVDSRKHEGSTFFIFFPVTERRPSEGRTVGAKPETGYGTVLLVDDEETVLEVTAEMIRRLGYTVLTARSGREALERYAEHQAGIRLVILDMIMPEMSGGELFDRLKALNPAVKVLLASGFSMQGQAREIMQRGCGGFIQKPFCLEDLSVRVKMLLNDP
jgi:PAS domain S-box-containing protein